MSRVVPFAIGGLILAAFAATLFFLWQRAYPEPEPFETVAPAVRDITRETIATGSVEPRHVVELKSRVGGIIEKLEVEPGDRVRSGQMVAKVRIIPDVVRLNQAEAAVDAARIRYDAAKREYERFEALSGVVANTQIAERTLEFKLASQQLATAKNNLVLVREGAVKGSSKASNLVTATVPGMVLDVPVELGVTVVESNQFNSGTTIATVADMADMIFIGFVDESEVGKLRKGMPLSLQLGALPDLAFEGTLEHIAPQGKRRDGTMQFEVRAAIKMKDGIFVRAGFSANASIVLEHRGDVLAIDESVLRFEGEEIFVEVEAQPQVFDRRRIEVGLSDGRFIEVVGGLEVGERVKKPRG